MKKLFLLSIFALVFAFQAAAEDKKPRMSELSPKQRKEYLAKKQSEWNKKSKEEKLAFVEKQRTEKLQKLAAKIKQDDEKWKKMSADEKIAKHERTLKMLEGRIKKLDEKKKKLGC